MKVWIQHIGGDRSPIELASEPLASGGEGSLYHILSPSAHQHLVAKIYHPKKRTELRYNKILYLHEHPPKIFSDEIPITLVWPKELLFDETNQFIGFLMPLVSGQKLELLCLPNIPKRYDKEWNDFDFRVDVKLKKRLDLCFKIAQAIHKIHETDRYILVDMKPDNIMIDPNGAVALVDLDSVEVVENGETIYDAPVATPEYTPPDSYLKEVEVDPTQEDPWDRFGMAVIFYKLLLGVHPYAASAKSPYDKYTSLYEKIEQGMFVHNPEIKQHLSAIPDLHQKFHNLPVSIQKLFERAFIDGHHQQFLRPSAEEWVQALREYCSQHEIQNKDIEIPAIALDQLPNNINWDQFFTVPTTSFISQEPKLLVEKPINKKELKNKTLPTSIQDPKKIRGQRFFNFIMLLLIVVVSAAVSLMIPWYISAAIGLLAYLGFNYTTYRTRKSADRKDTIISILNHQMQYFKELIQSAEGYEQKIANYIEKIKGVLEKKPKELIDDLIHKKSLIQASIESFYTLIREEKKKLRTLRREEKATFKALQEYYIEQIEQRTQLPALEANTIRQKIQLLKRAKRLGKLSDAHKLRYDADLLTLENLQTQFEIEETELAYKNLEKSKDILFKCHEAYNDLLEEIKIYHQSVSTDKEKEVKMLIDDQRMSLAELERLQYDLRQLEKPLADQVSLCRRAKQNAALYQKINYGRHLLEMVGLAKPF